VTRRASLDSPRVRPPGRYRHAAGINTADQVEVHPPHEPGMLVGDRVERQLTSVMTSSLTRPHGCAWLVTPSLSRARTRLPSSRPPTVVASRSASPTGALRLDGGGDGLGHHRSGEVVATFGQPHGHVACGAAVALGWPPRTGSASPGRAAVLGRSRNETCRPAGPIGNPHGNTCLSRGPGDRPARWICRSSAAPTPVLG
jgi:hypothetical protein